MNIGVRFMVRCPVCHERFTEYVGGDEEWTFDRDYALRTRIWEHNFNHDTLVPWTDIVTLPIGVMFPQELIEAAERGSGGGGSSAGGSAGRGSNDTISPSQLDRIENLFGAILAELLSQRHPPANGLAPPEG